MIKFRKSYRKYDYLYVDKAMRWYLKALGLGFLLTGIAAIYACFMILRMMAVLYSH